MVCPCRNVPVTFKWFGLAPEITAGAVELVFKKAVWALGRVGSRAGQDKDDTPTPIWLIYCTSAGYGFDSHTASMGIGC